MSGKGVELGIHGVVEVDGMEVDGAEVEAVAEWLGLVSRQPVSTLLPSKMSFSGRCGQ